MHSPVDAYQKRLCALQPIYQCLFRFKEALIDFFLANGIKFGGDGDFFKTFLLCV